MTNTPWANESDVQRMAVDPLSKLEEAPSEKVHKESLVTFLVKSQKLGKICLGCVDKSNKWIRPIKPGRFSEMDIRMDNMKTIRLFDVVRMSFSGPFPINNHKENLLFASGTVIKFVKNLDEKERTTLLSQMANSRILQSVSSSEELFEELSSKSGSAGI